MCGESENGNRYRHDPDDLQICQCEPMEEVCIDPVVSLARATQFSVKCLRCSVRGGVAGMEEVDDKNGLKRKSKPDQRYKTKCSY